MLKQPVFGETEGVRSADDDVVKYSYVDQSKRFDQTLCNPLVGRGRVCNGAGVVVSKYHSSCVLCQCALGDFARINIAA